MRDKWLNVFWQRLRVPVPIQTVIGSVDLFHSPDFVLPPVGKTPALLTVHDLSYLRVPECYVPRFRKYLQGAVQRAVEKASMILADSESTRYDLIELLSVDPDRVTVLYPGVERRFQPVRDPALLNTVQNRYNLPDRFVLGLGTLQPRKNFVCLVEAFALLLASGAAKQHLEDLNLVIAGGKGWMYDDVFAAVSKLGLEGRVHFPGFVSDDDLPALYSKAELFAFPSLYEGFGLPVLEAMACGTPVVSADNSSLPEVVGKAGLLVDSRDSVGLAQKMLAIIENTGVRASLSYFGSQQARRFTWEAAAAQLLKTYLTFA
jgi:glycosyltransferase involved in cell wall biosynthesis